MNMLVRGYTNTRTGKQELVTIDGPGYSQQLDPRPSLQYFWATERFHWGHGDNYGASYQLSFALILHFCGAYEAWNHYESFGRDVISKLNKWIFALESRDVKSYVRWRNERNTLLGKLYWRFFARWMFSDDFYEFHFKKLQRSETNSNSTHLPKHQLQSLQTA